MVKKTTSKKYDSAKYKNFISTAKNFEHAAVLAFDFEYYNAAGVLFILSAIAYADAVTIKLSGKKSSGENHYEVIHLVEQVVPLNLHDKKAISNFKSLIDHKNLISYTGDIYHKKDVDKISRLFNHFSKWAAGICGEAIAM